MPIEAIPLVLKHENTLEQGQQIIACGQRSSSLLIFVNEILLEYRYAYLALYCV